MIASLPMYDRPSNRVAHDALWALIRDRLRARSVAAPDKLDRRLTHTQSWHMPDLVLGQICNLPLRRGLPVTVIGAADYGLEGCAPGFYRSAFMVRADDPRDTPEAFANARFAFNEVGSQSGYGAPQVWAHQRGFAFRNTLEFGAHETSIAAIANDDADIASIDTQTLRMLRAEGGPVDRLRIIGYTDPSPGQTFISAGHKAPDAYFDAIRDAMRALPTEFSDLLGLRGIVILPAQAYDLPFPLQRQVARAA